MGFPWRIVGELALSAGKYFLDRHDRAQEKKKRAEAESRRAGEAGDGRPADPRRDD